MPKEISLKEIDQLKITFSQSHSARRISKIEFRKLLKSEGVKLSDSKIQLLFFLVEPDLNGCIDFIEFLEKLCQDELLTTENAFLRNLFSYLDKDCNGSLDFDEFKQIADLFDDFIREEELKEYFDEVDVNEDGLVSYEEFEENESLQLMNSFFKKLMNDIDPEVKVIFDFLDKDKDGYLSFEEFKLLSSVEEFRNTDEIVFRECFDEMDRDRDGKISFKEFSEIVKDDVDSDVEQEDSLHSEDKKTGLNQENQQVSDKKNYCIKEKMKRFSLTVVEESSDF